MLRQVQSLDSLAACTEEALFDCFMARHGVSLHPVADKLEHRIHLFKVKALRKARAKVDENLLNHAVGYYFLVEAYWFESCPLEASYETCLGVGV